LAEKESREKETVDVNGTAVDGEVSASQVIVMGLELEELQCVVQFGNIMTLINILGGNLKRRKMI
jgi:hypothetical protein